MYMMDLWIICVGQFGKVYKGVYRKWSTEIEVAVKAIKICNSGKESENFIKEMSIMSTLLHPNIVRFFGITKQGETISGYYARFYARNL